MDPSGGGQESHVAAEDLVFLAEPPVVAVLAHAGDPVGCDQRAVEDHVCHAILVAARENVVLVGEDGDTLVQVAVAGSLGNAGLPGQTDHPACGWRRGLRPGPARLSSRVSGQHRVRCDGDSSPPMATGMPTGVLHRCPGRPPDQAERLPLAPASPDLILLIRRKAVVTHLYLHDSMIIRGWRVDHLRVPSACLLSYATRSTYQPQ